MSLEIASPFTPGLGGGQPGHHTLPGSGLSVPGGLECAFEYRGLLMNVRKNVDRYRITGIDGLADADLRDTRDANTDDDGEAPYNSFYGGRTIVLNGTIDTYSFPKLRDMQLALKSAFTDLTTEYPLIFRTGDFTKDHLIYCKKISSIAMAEAQTNRSADRDFQVSLRASDPRFLSFYQKFLDVTLPVSAVGISNPFLVANVVNAGTYKAQPIFRVYGPSTNATFINQDTGQSFAIAGGIGSNDWVEFAMGAPPGNQKYLRNRAGDAAWNVLSDNSQFISFRGYSPDTGVGNNRIYYYGDASRVQITWRDSWL